MKKLFVSFKYMQGELVSTQNVVADWFEKIGSEDDIDIIEEGIKEKFGYDEVCVINFRRME